MGIHASSSEAPSAGHHQTGGQAGLKEPLVYFGHSSATEYCPCDSIAAHLSSLAAVLLLIWGGGGGDKTLSSLSFGQPVVHLVSTGSGGCLQEGECGFPVPN